MNEVIDMALVGVNNEEKIWNYLKSKGFNDYGCAGMMGNLRAESALNPMNLQNSGNKKLGMTDEEYVDAVDNGTYTNFVRDSIGFGLAQWTFWSRKEALLNFVKSKGKSIGDLETQLDYLYEELSKKYRSVFDVLKSATSVRQASDRVLLDFERPANQTEANQIKRASYCQEYYDKYANKKDVVKMTEKELRKNVVAIAEKYVGCNEYDGSHRQIIDRYNSVTPLPRGYKVKYTDAWCATFVSAVSIEADLIDIMPRECGCNAMINLYKNLGRWQENDAYVPEIADIIMYDWDDNGSGECAGYPEHVGIVVSVSGNTIKVIEGNIDNAVGYRTLTVNGRYIRGYCLPNYESKATPVEVVTPAPAPAPSTSSSALNRTIEWTGYVIDGDLNVRTWAGVENKTCSFSPLKEGTEIGICDSVKAKNGIIWYYIKYKDKYGFVCSKYVTKTPPVSSKPASSNGKVDYAKSYDKSISGTYRTTGKLNMRLGAGVTKKIQCVIPKNDEVTCYGYYTSVLGTKWYLVSYKTYNGFVSSRYLKK